MQSLFLYSEDGGIQAKQKIVSVEYVVTLLRFFVFSCERDIYGFDNGCSFGNKYRGVIGKNIQTLNIPVDIYYGI